MSTDPRGLLEGPRRSAQNLRPIARNNQDEAASTTLARPRPARQILQAHDALLFACAYPPSRPAWEQAQAQLVELALEARRLSDACGGGALANSGIAATEVRAAFSLEITRWLPRLLRQGRALPGSPRERERRALVDLARGAMTALLRETDFFTYAHEAETELFDLGRGLRAALFARAADRKLALESYVGFLLIKNHVPIAYGGGWILGRQARFGVNVLPPFRGGESALALCQLLRLYAWRFRLKLFAIEPYQIGKANPDGIRSASFWFHDRLGFRPLQPALRALAASEFEKWQGSGIRTPAKLLSRLADSILAWETPLDARAGGPEGARRAPLRARAAAAPAADGGTGARRARHARSGLTLACLKATSPPRREPRHGGPAHPRRDAHAGRRPGAARD